MTQKISPFLEGKYGWDFGESGWNSGMDENLLKFSFMFDGNVDNIVSSLPAAANGASVYLTTDKRLYFAVGTTWYSTPTPKWHHLTIKSTGDLYQFDGNTLNPISSNSSLQGELDSIEVTLESLGTAAFKNVEDFASQGALDVVSAQANAYTDTLSSNIQSSSDKTKGASLVGFLAEEVGATGRTLSQKLSDSLSVLDFGAVGDGVVDDSLAVMAMLSATNRIYVPSGYTVVAKNIELTAGCVVTIDGCLKLPNGCADFDRLLFATEKPNIGIEARELDGNAPGQTGFIGTHILYMRDCDDLDVNIRHIHDHYCPAGVAFATADGVRDGSSGCVLIYRSKRAKVQVGLLDSWGREGIQLRECTHSTVSLGHAQGYAGGSEYSGVQVSGSYNKVIRASVDNAGASGVGFDTTYGTISNIIATNTRENHGVNFGHTGFPATGSVANNILVDGTFRHGISVGASTNDLSISNFSIRNAGEYGLNFSDGVSRARISNGVVSTNGVFNLNSSAASVDVRSTRFSDVDTLSVSLDTVTGVFTAGETVTSSSGATGVVRRVLKNRAADKQILFLNTVSGTFAASNTVTGDTSTASGTASLVSTPIARREVNGGTFAEESALSSGGLGTTTKLADGTLIHRHTVVVPASASTLATVTTNYPVAAAWIEPPHVSATVVATSSTDTFNLERLSVTRTTAAHTVKLKASVGQTYSVDVISIGRWK